MGFRNKYIKLLNNERAITLIRKLLFGYPVIDGFMRLINYRIKKLLYGRMQRVDINACKKEACFAIPSNSISTKDSGRITIFFDASAIALRDVNTGIQRVVKSIYNYMVSNQYSTHILPVVAQGDGTISAFNGLDFAEGNINKKALIQHESISCTAQSHDIFFSADLHLIFPFSSLVPLSENGTRIIFTIYDIFGLQENVDLPKAYYFAFHDWFTGVMAVTDAIICDSRAVADEIKVWLEHHPGLRERPLPIGYFHLGADITTRKYTLPLNDEKIEEADVLRACAVSPTLLMVGTVEPRKGHAPALDAVEVLWKEGIQLNLVIVGKEGWRSHDLVRRLRRHPQRNKQLFWLEKASDALLMQLYAQCTALLAASYAEGFGLPLIEAAHYGLPIIARDIPVFHEVAGDFAFYFPNTDSAALADSLRHWLQLHAEGKAPQSRDMPYLTWAQSTQQLLKVILENDWYTTYQPTTPLDTH